MLVYSIYCIVVSSLSFSPSMPFWPLKVDSLSHVFPAFVNVQRKERCPLYKILSTLAVYAQWTIPRTCIDYQLECMLLPLQFKLYMLELRGRSCTSRQSDDVFHQRRENSLVTGILVVSGCLLLFVFPGSEAVFRALVKHIVTLPVHSRSSSQF